MRLNRIVPAEHKKLHIINILREDLSSGFCHITSRKFNIDDAREARPSTRIIFPILNLFEEGDIFPVCIEEAQARSSQGNISTV